VGIIDAGAGFFTTEEKVKFTLAKAEVIYLEVAIEELVKRLNSEEERAKRPLLSEGDLRFKLEKLLSERSSFYALAEKVREG
jgi:shikimate kinase